MVSWCNDQAVSGVTCHMSACSPTERWKVVRGGVAGLMLFFKRSNKCTFGYNLSGAQNAVTIFTGIVFDHKGQMPLRPGKQLKFSDW